LGQPVILVDPLPRTLDLIMEPSVRERLERLGRVVLSEKARMPDAVVDANLADVALIIGQTALPRERLDQAKNLKAIFNVETNLLPNIDYQACQERGIWVLTPTSAFASAVAESAIAMAIDLARGITAADRAFRSGTERYGLDGNAETFRFANAPVGIIGFGDLGRNLRELIRPFRNPVKVYDPWLPADLIAKHDCTPTSLEDLLATSRVIFMFASVTSENEAMIGRREFELVRPGTAFLLMSRAAVVDFAAMLEAARSGHIRVATDVFPSEPVAADDPVRQIEGLLLSAHRTGGTTDALFEIGSMTVADAELVMRGLPPQMCRRADPSVAARMRSKPVSVT
jgi:phosphoglycerate dehydrogenase-like enzyme